MQKTSTNERQQVEEWLNSKEENRTYFNDLKEWFDKDVPPVSFTDAEIVQDWQKVKEKAKQSAANKTKKLRRSWFIRIAAVLVVGLAFGLLYLNFFKSTEAPLTYKTQNAQQLRQQAMALADGTKIWLNKGSKIHFPEKFSRKNRTVRLEGEGYFEVKRDEARPFIVQTQGVDIKVLGTSFNINQKDSSATKVTVNSGKVAVSTKDGQQSVTLIKGEVSDFIFKTRRLSKTFNQDLNYLSWQTGTLSFKKATMGQIVQDLQRHYRVKVSCSDELRSKFGFNGTFKKRSLKEIIQVLEATLDVKASDTQEGVFIK